MNDMKTKENRIHSNEIKPYSYYHCIIPQLFSCVPMHWHDEFEISFIREGAAEFICGEEKFTSSSGDIIITQPNVLHSIYPLNGTKQIYDTIVFSKEMFGNSQSDRFILECITPLESGEMKIICHITPKHHYYSQLALMTENIFSCAKGNTPRLDMLLRSEIIRLLWLLEEDAIYDALPCESSAAIRPALEYISLHFSEQITIKQLAESCHLSESYFMRRFKQHVGIGAVKYLNHFRIDRICRQLISVKKNIVELAMECGYSNISNFNRQFKKITGCSPSEYRNKNI